MATSRKVGETSMKLASRWANELRSGDPQLKEFCLFFDLVTQSGGMKNVWLEQVRAFIAETGRQNVDNTICDWITSRPSDVDHLTDGRKNASLWKNNVVDADLELFTLVYLRCLKSKKQYQVVALNRKGTIALTRGWVNGGLVDLPQLLAEADIVTIHAVLTDETRHLIGEKALRGMKPTAILINTARGELVDEAAVARAVEERWIAAAAVDAFAQEPLPAQHPYRTVDPERLILTPHNVGHSEAGRRANLALALEQILAVGRGEPPAHVINPEAMPIWRMKA